MNKKKRSQSAKGFAGGEGSSAPAKTTTSSSSSASAAVAATTNPTLIQPKQPPSKFKYAGSIRPGLQSPKRSVPSFSSGKKIIFPDYAVDGKPKARPTLFPWIIEVKKPEEIEKMRRAGRSAREVLDLAGRLVEAGITT
jgi:methionyl aminopeptidase